MSCPIHLSTSRGKKKKEKTTHGPPKLSPSVFSHSSFALSWVSHSHPRNRFAPFNYFSCGGSGGDGGKRPFLNFLFNLVILVVIVVCFLLRGSGFLGLITRLDRNWWAERSALTIQFVGTWEGGGGGGDTEYSILHVCNDQTLFPRNFSFNSTNIHNVCIVLLSRKPQIIVRKNIVNLIYETRRVLFSATYKHTRGRVQR